MIPEVVSGSREEAASRLAEARVLVGEDGTISFGLTASMGGVASVEVRGTVDVAAESSESATTFDYGDGSPMTLEFRILRDRVFGRLATEPCWLDYGAAEAGLAPWLPAALAIGTEAEAVGLVGTDETQIVGEVSALTAVSVASSKLANSLPPEAQATEAVVPVLLTLAEDGRIVQAAFNYEDALDALAADGIDLAELGQGDPDLAGASSQDLRDSMAAGYVATYAPAGELEIEVPGDDERVDFFALDQSDPNAPIECGATR